MAARMLHMKGAATMVLCWHVRSLYARRKQLRPRENGCHLVESDVLCDTLGKNNASRGRKQIGISRALMLTPANRTSAFNYRTFVLISTA